MSEQKVRYEFIHLKYSDGHDAYYVQVKKKKTFILQPTTLEYLQKCINNDLLDTYSITIKYKKDFKFLVCRGEYVVIAEFDNGKLNHSSIDSGYFYHRFYV